MQPEGRALYAAQVVCIAPSPGWGAKPLIEQRDLCRIGNEPGLGGFDHRAIRGGEGPHLSPGVNDGHVSVAMRVQNTLESEASAVDGATKVSLSPPANTIGAALAKVKAPAVLMVMVPT